MEYQLYGGRSLALNSNVPNYMNNYTMPMMNSYGAYNYYNPAMQGYGYNASPMNFGQNIPTNYTSAATNIANASNNAQAPQVQQGASDSIFKGLNQQETQALKNCYIKGQEPSEGFMGAAFGGVTMGLMNNPRYLAHPINTIKGSYRMRDMFAAVKDPTSNLHKLWTDPKTNNVIREAYFQMNKASSRAAGWKFGLFRKRYTEAEFNALKDIMDKALKSGNVDEIAKARRDASVDKRVLKQIEIAKYFGVSTATIRKWEDKGLPFGRIGDQKFYDKEKCRAWVLAQ